MYSKLFVGKVKHLGSAMINGDLTFLLLINIGSAMLDHPVLHSLHEVALHWHLAGKNHSIRECLIFFDAETTKKDWRLMQCNRYRLKLRDNSFNQQS
jgi:hypothetical protein